MEILGKVSVKVKGAGSEQYTIEGGLDEKASLRDFLQFTKKSLISIAVDALKREQDRGFDKNPVVVVDGKKNKSILDVSPLGKIQFVAKVQGTSFLLETYEQIMTRSKVVTGTYIEGNYVFFNNKRVARNMVEFKSWLDKKPEFVKGDMIRFANVVPYARKLERYGVRAGIQRARREKSKDKKQRSGPLILAPNGAYFLAHRAIARKYKQNVAQLKFEFILGSTIGLHELPSISKNNKNLRKTFSNRGDTTKKTGPYLYPSIKIVIGETGII